MLKPPQRPGPTPPARALAPHVQAAVGRTAQARMPERASLPVRQPAPHVQAAQAAIQRVAQPKPAVASAPRRVILPPPVHRPRVAGQAGPGTVQMNGGGSSSLPENITGMDRDGATVKTAGGTWKAKRYVAVKRLSHAPAWGCSMTLEFTPEYPVSATKIALVQTVMVMKNKAPYYHDNQTIEDRTAGGASIDQAAHSRSPLYADDPEKAKGSLGETALQEKAGEHGHHYREAVGRPWKVKPAWLKDVPHLRDVDSFSSQVFETTALAVAGEDAGAYYGSVSWGWYTQDGSDVYIYPLAVESKGSASEGFQKSVEKWNETKTSKGATPQQLPPVAPRRESLALLPPSRLSPGNPYSSIKNEDL